jgi:predicted esterase
MAGVKPNLVRIHVQRGIAYGHGQALDTYTPPDAAQAPVVLLWHGVGANQRDVLEPLARTTAALGVTVLVPDWQSGTADGGRAQLLASLSFTRRRVAESGGDDGGIVLAGWSRGGKAAAGLAINPAAVHGWQPSAVVCLGSGFKNPAPTTGSSVLTDLTQTTAAPVPFWLVHGTKDPVVDISQSREFAALLARRGWPVHLEEVPTDHAGVVMAHYDPQIERVRPATDRDAMEAGRLSAHVLHTAVSAATASLRAGQLGQSDTR